MEEKVGYQPEEPTKPPVETDDWRVQEMYNMAPDAVMEELLGLSEEICKVKHLWEEAKAELRQAQERLKLMEAQVLQVALDSKDKAVSDQVKGSNAEVRKRKADIYLADHLTVKQLAFEVKPLESLEAAARVAMETLLERSKNLHQWARMFEAQVRLLSTVRVIMPESVPPDQELAEHLANLKGMDPKVLRVAFDGLAAQLFPGLEPDVRIVFDFVKTPESSVVYEDAQKWMAWYENPVGSPPVDTVELIERIIEVQKSGYVGEEPEPDGARWKAIAEREIAKSDPVTPSQVQELNEPHKEALAQAVDELFPLDVEIPPSMDVPEEEVDDMKAAMERYQDIGEKADESSGPSL